MRLLGNDNDLDLTVFFCSSSSTRRHFDRGFGREIVWDVPLLDGYKHEFLPALRGTDTSNPTFRRPINYGLAKRLRHGRFDVLWVNGYFRWINWVAIATAKQLGMRTFVRDDVNLLRGRKAANRAAKVLLFRWLRQACDGFLTIGSLNEQFYREYGVPPRKLFRVPFAVDNDFFQKRATEASGSREELRRSLGLEPGRPVILFASKFIRRKRAPDLWHAYKRLSPNGCDEPNPYLLFIGDGEERAQLEAEVAQTKWSTVRFLGFANQSALPRYYDLCDVFVLPSVDEPFGLVVNEVMNVGRPIIVSDQVGCGPDLVKDGGNGYVFPAGNTVALAQALQAVLGDPDRARSMGTRSLEIIQSWDYSENVRALKAAFLTASS